MHCVPSRCSMMIIILFIWERALLDSNDNVYNIYCDESCHLEHDASNVMVLGAICCPSKIRYNIYNEIREIKKKYHLSPNTFEIKWTKVSDSKIDFYLELVDYFMNNSNLSFRGLIVPDKTIINNRNFLQDWETFYYKMYYQLLKNLINPQYCYNIFVDIKDTNGARKRKKLLEILNKISSDMGYSKDLVVKNLQAIRSEEVEILQLTDFLMGAICYENRKLNSNLGKVKIIQRLKDSTGYPLTKSTFPNESKFNLFKIKLQGDSRE